MLGAVSQLGMKPLSWSLCLGISLEKGLVPWRGGHVAKQTPEVAIGGLERRLREQGQLPAVSRSWGVSLGGGCWGFINCLRIYQQRGEKQKAF